VCQRIEEEQIVSVRIAAGTLLDVRQVDAFASEAVELAGRANLRRI